MGNRERSKRALTGKALLGAILILSFVNDPYPTSAEDQTKSSAQLETELAARTAELDKTKADLLQIKTGIATIDGLGMLPEGRLKREVKHQAYRAYLQYVAGVDPDYAGFILGAEATGLVTPEEMKKGLEKKKLKYEGKVSALETEIPQLRTKVQQAKAAEQSEQFQQLQPGASSRGTRSQSGTQQPPTYTAPPQPPSQPSPGSAGVQPPTLPPGTYVTAFEVFCPGEAAAKEPVRCTARGVYLHDPNTVVDLTESTTWDITGATEWKSGSEFRTKGAAVIIVTATRGNNRVTRTVHVKARRTETGSGTTPEGAGSAPPTGGGGCGPRFPCTCAGGLKGHIPCEPSKGPCHCGAG